jgi:hypothetical protein
MHLAVVDMEVQRPARLEHAEGFHQARLEKCQVIVEQVGVGAGANLVRDIATALESGAVGNLPDGGAASPARRAVG